MATHRPTRTILTGSARRTVSYRLNGEHDIVRPAAHRAPIAGPAVGLMTTGGPVLSAKERREMFDALVASTRTPRKQGTRS